jgi:hypothetical protein
LQEDSYVDEEKLIEFCRDMGFYNESVQIKQLIQDIWNHLKGNESGSVSLYNIKTFLCAIMNFNYPWMKPAQTAEEALQYSINN